MFFYWFERRGRDYSRGRGGRDVTVAGGQGEASTQPVIIYLYIGESGLRVQTGFVGEYKQYTVLDTTTELWLVSALRQHLRNIAITCVKVSVSTAQQSYRWIRKLTGVIWQFDIGRRQLVCNLSGQHWAPEEPLAYFDVFCLPGQTRGFENNQKTFKNN